MYSAHTVNPELVHVLPFRQFTCLLSVESPHDRASGSYQNTAVHLLCHTETSRQLMSPDQHHAHPELLNLICGASMKTNPASIKRSDTALCRQGVFGWTSRRLSGRFIFNLLFGSVFVLQLCRHRSWLHLCEDIGHPPISWKCFERRTPPPRSTPCLETSVDQQPNLLSSSSSAVVGDWHFKDASV